MNLSDRRTKPNCGEVQSTISSASRDRCMAAMLAAAKSLEREVAVGDGVERIGGGPREAERLGGRVAVDGEARAGERRGAERTLVEPPARIREAAAVAGQHLDIGEQMMAEGDGLGGLQMGEARHDRGGVVERLVRPAPAAGARAAPSIASIASRT